MIRIFSAVSIVLLSACGGSSEPSSSPPDTPALPSLVSAEPLQSRNGLDIYADINIQAGQSIGLAAIATSNSKLTEPLWRQVSGPGVTMLADRSQLSGFDVHQGGDYVFEFSAINSSGQRLSDTLALSVSEADSELANIRLDHVVTEGAGVSLKVDGEPGKTITDIQWNQTAGPRMEQVRLEDEDGFLFFTAPNVQGDQIIEVEATLYYSDGSAATDTGMVLVKDVDIDNEDGYFPHFADRIVTTDIHPYIANSPYAGALNDCVYNNLVDESCRFSRLPLIGQQHSAPSVDDVLQRTLVSHQWMGDRFRQYLQQSEAGEDMLQLLRAVTAVVISYDIRPSFYWSATGAIYLDANNFWVTPEERDTLNNQPDYRSGFGSDLQFFMPWRYVRNNNYYLVGSPQEQRLTRPFADLEASVSWLMYHELAHANDFFPPADWQNIGNNTSPLGYSNNNPPSSDQLEGLYPLFSEQMQGLALVSFAGETPSEDQRNYSADDVAAFFAPDRAASYYSYLNYREDFATLFERFMMSYRLGANADVAVMSRVNNEGNIVTWGQRDRFNHPSVQNRARLVVNQVLPGLDVTSIQNQLPEPVDMTPGLSWGDNLAISEEMPSPQKVRSAKPIEDFWMTLGPHHSLPNPSKN